MGQAREGAEGWTYCGFYEGTTLEWENTTPENIAISGMDVLDAVEGTKLAQCKITGGSAVSPSNTVTLKFDEDYIIKMRLT
jgi:hypothetical protein